VSSRNVLLVVLEPVPDEQVRAAVHAHGDDVTVHVVAPAAHSSMLQWLTGADDDARAEADELAAEAAEAVDAEVETEVGDRDPLLAVEDALALFPADEIVLAGEMDADTEAALRGLGLPVSHLNGAHHAGARTSERSPILVLGAMGTALLGLVALVSAVALVVYFLA
jgi:hypothetical protein